MRPSKTAKVDVDRPPLDRAVVSLTEAATWVVEGNCWDDDYLIEQERRALDDDGHGQCVEVTNQAMVARDQGYGRFYALLWEECVVGNIVLNGIEYREDACVSGEHTVVPESFFLRPTYHSRGDSGGRLKGELSPDVVECCDDIVEGNDRRPTYGDVRSGRKYVELIATIYDAPGQSSATRAERNPRRGRSATYDWPSFNAAAIRALDDRGDVTLPSDPEWNQADLERHMRNWCTVNWTAVPAESTIREHVSSTLETFRALRQWPADHEGR